MQTLTSLRRRGWSGRIASLPLSFFSSFFHFLGKATGRTVRPICRNESSFDDVTRINFRFRLLVTWSSPRRRGASSHII